MTCSSSPTPWYERAKGDIWRRHPWSCKVAVALKSDADNTTKLKQTATAALQLLRQHPEGLAFTVLQARIDAPEATLRRALNWLRKEQQAPLHYDRASRTWALRDSSYTLPLLAPEADDVTALMLAAALLEPVVDEATRRRVERVLEDLDAIRYQKLGNTGPVPAPRSISTTVTMGTSVDSRLLKMLLSAAQRSVLQIDYDSPWYDRSERYVIEPWQVRVQDGSMYLRAWSRTRNTERTFSATLIKTCQVLQGERPQQPVPRPAEIWGAEDPAFGLDEHEPDEARIELVGAVARWVSHIQWHPAQQDRWIEPGQRLERVVPYRSRREFARRLLSIIDALCVIEPVELRDQLEAYLFTYRDRLLNN